jgi:hypothetical protein
MKAIQPTPGTTISVADGWGNNGLLPLYSNPQLPSRFLLSAQDSTQTLGPRSKRKYQCTLPRDGKSFSPKPHLDILMRAYTGDKPFVSGHLPVP